MRRPGYLTGRWLLATAAIVVLAAVLAGLGFWQLNRLGQRRASNAYQLQRLEQVPLDLAGQPLDPVEADLHRAVVRGTFDYAQEFVLRNRALNELPGVHVITPLRISGSATAVLVDRGWIPYDMAEISQRQGVVRPDGIVEIRGILRQSQRRRSPLSPPDPPLGPDRPRLDAWFRIDIPAIQQQIPYPLLPLFLEEERSVVPNAHLPRPDPDLQLSEGSHFTNAIQWFSFAGIVLLGYSLFYHQRGVR